MVHADSSNFEQGVTKEEAYAQVLEQAAALFDGQRNWGKVACQTILFGKGVCGAAAQRKEPVVVPDVEEFPGHIACDGDSASEIVVPIFNTQKEVMAIIDIDCAEKEGFDEIDREALVKLADLLSASCDWS